MRISSLGNWGALALSSAVALSGCSKDSNKEEPKIVNVQTGDDPDPCTLAADAELEAISGKKPVRHVSEPYAGKSQCTWYDAEEMILFVVAIKEARYFEQPLRNDLQYAPVTGVGDEAFLSSGTSVYVRTPKLVFYAQSLFPVADGNVSVAVQTAVSSLSSAFKNEAQMYEGGYRLGKIVAGKL